MLCTIWHAQTRRTMLASSVSKYERAIIISGDSPHVKPSRKRKRKNARKRANSGSGRKYLVEPSEASTRLKRAFQLVSVASVPACRRREAFGILQNVGDRLGSPCKSFPSSLFLFPLFSLSPHCRLTHTTGAP